MSRAHPTEWRSDTVDILKLPIVLLAAGTLATGLIVNVVTAEDPFTRKPAEEIKPHTAIPPFCLDGPKLAEMNITNIQPSPSSVPTLIPASLKITPTADNTGSTLTIANAAEVVHLTAPQC